MKNLALKREDEKNFIVAIEEEEKTPHFRVKYADGTTIGSIINNQENYNKLEQIMEEQAATAVEHHKSYKGKVVTDGVGMILSASVPPVGAYIVNSNLPLAQENPEVAMIAAGVIALGSIAHFVYKWVKDRATLKEVEKIKYRDEHREILDGFKDHPNALNGIEDPTYSNIVKAKKPFGIINLDHISDKELERIVENIEKENDLPVTYAKTAR